MFARIVEFIPDFEKKEELIKTLRNQVLPILKKQSGFLEILPLFPENECGQRKGTRSALSAKRIPECMKS
ncbi:MAG: hypothetical protein DMG73_05390 [Acidobacteria bacterium]|nr:MAG: hypothetical protein DMG73_05390 [Acidobacteriota bacterium]